MIGLGDGSQMGDMSAGNVAGGNVNHYGASWADLVALIKEMFVADQKREIRDAEINQHMSDLRDEINLYRIAATQRLDAFQAALRRRDIVLIGLCVAVLLLGVAVLLLTLAFLW